jgi:hypothetical protein
MLSNHCKSIKPNRLLVRLVSATQFNSASFGEQFSELIRTLGVGLMLRFHDVVPYCVA